VMAGLARAREKPLNRWLFAMGIRQVGEGASKELARLHASLTELAGSEVLAELRADTRVDAKKKNEKLAAYGISADVAQVVAEAIVAFFESEAGRHVLERMSELGIDPKSDNYQPKLAEVDLSQKPLAGKTFVITGTLSMGRDEMKRFLESKGAKVSGSVSGNTSYLLLGEDGGSKHDKAVKLGVPVIDEKGLRAMVG